MAEKNEESLGLIQGDEIKKYLSMSLDELTLSFIFYRGVSFRGHPTIHELITYGLKDKSIRMSAWNFFSKWLNENRDKLHNKICIEWKYCEKRNDNHWDDESNLIAGISDVIAILCVGFPPFLIPTILIKLGLDNVCGCFGKYKCQGITKSGKPCSRLVSKRKGYCWQHKKEDKE